MSRITAVPALAVLFAVACGEPTTGPGEPKPGKPLFQSTASEVQCIGSLSGTFQNVIVPSGAFCFLHNSTLTGNLKALPGSQVTTTNNTIAGSIQADQALFADFIGDRVGGNIEIFDGPGRDPFVVGFLDYRVRDATVLEGNIHLMKNRGNIFVEANTLLKGNIKVEDNFTPLGSSFIVQNNEVPRNLQVFKNMGSGTKVVQFNIAGQSVECFENQPVFNGNPNTAPVLKGQCGVPPTAF